MLSGLGLIYLSSLSTKFNSYNGSQFYWRRKPHNVVSRTPQMGGFGTHNYVDERHWLHKQL
jgi:hypothetical protein